MAHSTDFTLAGHGGNLHAREWSSGDASQSAYVALLCHGYGEHLGRYEWVADRLVSDGAAVLSLDHLGHGESDGERVLIDDFEPVVEDFHLLGEAARERYPNAPIVLIGHSMGGMIAARYAQRFPEDLTAVVLSGPVLGRWDAVASLLALETIPDVPIDPATLSRDLSVGDAYVADPLVWHGPFKRPTVEALGREIDVISSGGTISLPMAWLHGSDDQLVPYDGTASGWPAIEGELSEAKTYPGARHEIFNETNRAEVLDDVTSFIHRHLG